ncbi:SCO7613 C-terminal domain-containing membrane protein [Streptomyces sp. NPDC058405]|uniref:SCO7613 C-terminal domain-containing membrane protein n=1 Tax=Streptomyces sp. NPDC058405 TaxID=3346482 RepID=UPI00365D795D
MENVPHPAQELAVLDQELAGLDARRARLLARRAYLVSLLSRPVPPPARPVPPFAHAVARPFAPVAETSPPSAQNVLLTLGGILLTIAAVAFTLVSWGRLGIGGRSAVLTTVTLLALTAPALLLRRGLASTAETVAAFGLVLMVLDAYAVYQVALPGTDSVAYTAAAAAVLAALWAGYGSVFGRLRIPLPAAVVTAQLPLPLWALSAGASALTTAWALLLTAALDTALVLWAKPRAVRTVGMAAAWATAGGALLTGGRLSVAAETPLAAAGPAALLLAAAALGLFAAWRATDTADAATVCAAVAGLAAVAAAGGVVRAGVPDGWAVAGYLLCGVALLTVVRAPWPRPAVRGLSRAAGAAVALSVLWALPAVLVVLLGAVTRVAGIWTGAPGGAREALGQDLPWAEQTAAPLVLLTAAGAAVMAYRELSGTPEARTPAADARSWRVAALCAAVALGWAAVLVLPPVLDLGYPAAVALPLLLTAGVLALAVRPRGPAGPAVAVTALVCALTGSAGVSLLSLATRTTTVTVLAALSALFAAAAVIAETVWARSATAPGRPAPEPVRTILACTAVGYATALAAAAGAAAGLSAGGTALAVLTVPAAVALLGARLRNHPVAPPVEITAAGAGLLAVVLAASGGASVLALVLALCGVIAAGTAVRAERRPVAGYAATALFVLATWVRLAASDVSAPEAYTLPVTVPALAVGLLRRRRDPEASSWTAYGPGLAATLLPSLLAAWGDAHWPRPLLLGLAALAVTLAGARLRLQAPLVLGGAVLALDALHELAPYVVQVAGALPRWLPPALAGLLLLAVGATYEQRLRDARRLRRTLGRMR